MTELEFLQYKLDLIDDELRGNGTGGYKLKDLGSVQRIAEALMLEQAEPVCDDARCEVCGVPTTGDTLCNLHYEELERKDDSHRGNPWDTWAEKHAGRDDDHDHFTDDEPERSEP
jgi:hypothetical protein